MAADWKLMPLGDVVTLQRGFDLPTQDRQPGTVPIVSSSGITGTHSEARVKGPGVVTGRYGTIGEVFYISDDFWPLNTTLYVRDFKGNDPLFVSYLLRTIDYGAHNDKSSVPGVNRNHLHTVPVLRPSLPEQRAIAHILGTLDDKIALNRRMNATLEEMARALFRSWFVDFDPVRAKAEGRQPVGMDAATAALFPNGFEGTEFGEIPQGWHMGSLGEIARQERRSALPTEIPPGTPYIGLEHMPRRSIALAEWGNSESVVSQKLWFRRGELLFGKLRPYFHKVGVAVVDGVCSTDIVVIAPKDPAWFGVALGTISSDDFVAFVTASSDGTKMPRTRWEDMRRYPLVIPPPAVVRCFTHLVTQPVTLIRNNILQSRTVAATRDALLPKLLSGEIRVREAERAVEAAVEPPLVLGRLE